MEELMNPDGDFEFLRNNEEIFITNYEIFFSKDASNIDEELFRKIVNETQEVTITYFDKLAEWYEPFSENGWFHFHLLDRRMYDFYLKLSKMYKFNVYRNVKPDEFDFKISDYFTVTNEQLVEFMANGTLMQIVKLSKDGPEELLEAVIIELLKLYDSMLLEERIKLIQFLKEIINMTRSINIVSRIKEEMLIDALKTEIDSVITANSLWILLRNNNLLLMDKIVMTDEAKMTVILSGNKKAINKILGELSQDTIDTLCEKLLI